jgi:hypothetical protein
MRIISAIFALAISAYAAPALSQTAPEAIPDTAAVLTAPTDPVGADFEPQPMTVDMLAAESGQGVSNTVLTEQQLNATSSGNSVIAGGAIQTGDIAFSSAALNGFAGIGNFVVNTGNNSTLQGSINVSIVTGPMQ